jgi:signal transduction histidine kinase
MGCGVLRRGFNKKHGDGKMITLLNNLTAEERLQLPRLFNHDSIGVWQRLAGFLDGWKCGTRKRSDADKAMAFFKHLSYFEKCVSQLCNEEYLCSTPPLSFNRIIGNLENMFRLEIEKKDNAEEEDYFEEISYSCLYNLIDNAYNTIQEDIKVKLIAEKSGFPSQAVYTPEGARDYKDFVAFRIQDNGAGFPPEMNLFDRLTTCPPKGGHGLGLYFTGLVSKVLRAPVDIQSKPGDTTVTFYHPIYEEEGK